MDELVPSNGPRPDPRGKYDSIQGRQLCKKILAKYVTYDPHDYILDGVCPVIDGFNLLATTPTGSGKTGFFTLLMLVREIAADKTLAIGNEVFPINPVMIVVCPTKALEEDIATQSREAGLTAIVINSDTVDLARKWCSRCAMIKAFSSFIVSKVPSHSEAKSTSHLQARFHHLKSVSRGSIGDLGSKLSNDHTDRNADIQVPTTPVPELLGGYLVPTPIQTQLILDTLSTAQSYISQIDNEIIRLMSNVEELQSKRADLLKYTQSHIALSAPVRRFPPEILSEIFLHCMETKWFNPAYYEHLPRLDRAPLLLGSVCRQWRAITLSTPRLWASFTLTIRPKYLKSDVVLAKTWLGRAGRCPLSINLGSEGSYQNLMRPLMQVFALNCERWYEIFLSLPPAVMASLSSVKNRLPRLQKLAIVALPPTIIDHFSCAPRLRHLNLGSAIPPSIIKVPWNQLQCFTLGMLGADSCLEYLRLTPNLLECTLTLASGSLFGSQPPVQLPQLRSIILRGDPSCILDSLQVPELRDVSICPWGCRWTATPQLTSLFLRCSLRVFSFDLSATMDCPSDNDMIQLLRTSPTLVELHLRGFCMTSSFLTQFACHQGSGDSRASCLVPSLHTMTVDWLPSYFNILKFAESIRSRMAFNVLQRVEICHNPVEDTEFLRSTAPSRLRELRDMGLDIRVRHRNRDLI
ncbi:hypothetical protein PILCRDRAFT_14986 [Piloderma croceum F 1598]|uniref:DEAD/DEAH-box helicase domain-containing protein n=1 Tax=Piloderma croceum (strain F 1598) TaxID=765440 RepID=A0A0C3EMF7_PILCF|nr:hypothetical protein PILCRDRAFT_14986 [Piloderma croceum F 1598]